MVNVTAPRCAHPDGCLKRPSFGPSGGKAVYCSSHKEESMVDVKNGICNQPGCRRRPVFRWIGERVKYCRDHKEEGMIYLNSSVCMHPGCVRRRKKVKGPIDRRRNAGFCSLHNSMNATTSPPASPETFSGATNTASGIGANSGCEEEIEGSTQALDVGKVMNHYCPSLAKPEGGIQNSNSLDSVPVTSIAGHGFGFVHCKGIWAGNTAGIGQVQSSKRYELGRPHIKQTLSDEHMLQGAVLRESTYPDWWHDDASCQYRRQSDAVALAAQRHPRNRRQREDGRTKQTAIFVDDGGADGVDNCEATVK